MSADRRNTDCLIFKIRKVAQEEIPNSVAMRITFQSSQDLLEDDPRNAYVFRPFDDTTSPRRLRVIDSVQNEDPNACIDDDHANRRPRRISERSPSHLTLPASRRMRWRRALRTSRRRARSTTSFVKREPVSCFAVST